MGEKVALIAGAGGIVGRAVFETMQQEPAWRVIGLSRRAVAGITNMRHVAVDLMDRGSIEAAGDALRDTTHIFYAAYQKRPTSVEEIAPNLEMLRNLIETVEPFAPNLQHIQLVQGSKWYGSQYGAYRTPAREEQSRHPLGVFYYAQQDWLAARQKSKTWTWSAVRPHGIWGFAIGSQLNMMQAVAVYATVMKHMGLPLHFPGKLGAYNAVYQMTEASHLAKAMIWAATSATAVNQAFNITNGDFVRWKYLWPVVADWFAMPLGEVQPFDLAALMADKEPMWAQIREQHGLASYSIRDLTTWDAAISYLFSVDWDQMSAMTKAQQAGWTEVIDTYEMVPRQFERLVQERAIPSWKSPQSQRETRKTISS
jgi:nucleoside-diphosphate-sugar epimerase